MRRTPAVTAIIATYNEEDIIGAVITDLMDQRVRVHLLDQGSSDATVAEAERAGKPGLLKVEHLDGTDFSLERIIRRKELLAAELDTDWVVNADADEFRESPWPGIGFAAGIEEVDRLGFNAIDFAVFNFLPVHDGFRKGDDPREVFRFYEPGAIFDRLQVRCWRKQPGRLDLISTGGHEARFPDRRVFPLRFLLRHYPIRGQAHGERKVFKERRARFAPDERARGWHVQYDAVEEGASFLREPSSLTAYDPGRVRLDLALWHRGVEALEQQLEATRRDLATVRGELAATRDELLSARNHVSLLDCEMSAAKAAGETHRQHAEWLQDELRRRGTETFVMHQQFEAAEQRRTALQYRLDAVLASRIWRWTTSLRALMDSVSRR